jgi:hypothetical protein
MLNIIMMSVIMLSVVAPHMQEYMHLFTHTSG